MHPASQPPAASQYNPRSQRCLPNTEVLWVLELNALGGDPEPTPSNLISGVTPRRTELKLSGGVTTALLSGRTGEPFRPNHLRRSTGIGLPHMAHFGADRITENSSGSKTGSRSPQGAGTGV